MRNQGNRLKGNVRLKLYPLRLRGKIFARLSGLTPLTINTVCCRTFAISIKHTLSSVNTPDQAANTRTEVTWRDASSVGENDSQVKLVNISKKTEKANISCKFFCV